MSTAPRDSNVADAADSPTTRVLAAVAERTGTDPIDLPPMYAAIDPDALDSLFEPARSGQRTGRITFSYAGHRVTVTCEAGRAIAVDLEPADEAASASERGREAGSTGDRFRIK